MISSYNGKEPKFKERVFVHESAVVIGDVQLDADVSVWPCAVLRGDVSAIRVQNGSNIQDGCVLHTMTDKPLLVGKNVVVGHRAALHSCVLEDDVLVGIGAIVLDGAVVGKGSWVAAGSVLPPGKIYPGNMLIMGSPAKAVRELTDGERAAQKKNVSRHIQKAQLYKETEKPL
ncbi:MAG: gamma carbonic anhydrase family protein [Christensenella sp.]|nr:gamma carbonic anhydrase family protein [Christensenella sp.]